MPIGESSCRDSRAWRKLLDIKATELSVVAWRKRNLAIYEKLIDEGHVDSSRVSLAAVRFLLKTLINEENPGALDKTNAGHIRAQNENILFFAAISNLNPSDFSISLTAGFIHDLNKSLGDPLRQDEFAVLDLSGKALATQSTLAESVGLNHLGERTRAALEEATRRTPLAISQETMQAIDACIIHHGLGSSRFIQRLVLGQNEWWGEEFWDAQNQRPRLVHPAQVPLTSASLIHDLADSAQQMQGDEGWIEKYPFGYWKDANRSLWQLLDAQRPSSLEKSALSLREQICVESATCEELIQQATEQALMSEKYLSRLQVAVMTIRRASEQWLDFGDEGLSNKYGRSLCHDIAAAFSCSPQEALGKLKSLQPIDPGADGIRQVMIQSARRTQATHRAMVAELLSS